MNTVHVNYEMSPEEMLRAANVYWNGVNLSMPRGIFVAWKREDAWRKEEERASWPSGIKTLECELITPDGWVKPSHASHLFKPGYRGANTEELLAYTATCANDTLEKAILGVGTNTWWVAFGPGYHADHPVVPAVGTRGRSFSAEVAHWEWKGFAYLGVKEVGDNP